MPKARRSAPTTNRSESIGISRSAGPRIATIAASTAVAAPTRTSVDRQPRTTPTASTIVSASTASTALAAKVVRKSRISWPTAAHSRSLHRDTLRQDHRLPTLNHAHGTGFDRCWQAPRETTIGNMTPFARGFHRRHRVNADRARVPPGQYLTDDFPVLSAGPTPYHSLGSWSFTIKGAVDRERSWSWDEFLTLPTETVTVDIHCVTKWSK